jgi:hypothetical protein
MIRKMAGGARGIARDMRGSYVPPLMVYFAAGVSGSTGIIEAFFVKEKLGLSVAMLASLGFGRPALGHENTSGAPGRPVLAPEGAARLSGGRADGCKGENTFL